MICSEKLNDAVKYSCNPEEILSLVNKGIKVSLRQGEGKEATKDGMDIALCAFDIATVIKDGKETKEDRYYISSLNGDAHQINRAIRKHWAIENSLHWVLDVTFNEDDCRVKTGHGAENLSIVRRIALNKLKSDTSEKSSLKIKRKLAGWDNNYALKIFNQMMAA